MLVDTGRGALRHGLDVSTEGKLTRRKDARLSRVRRVRPGKRKGRLRLADHLKAHRLTADARGIGTHAIVGAQLASLVADSEVEFTLPFKDRTKGEVVKELKTDLAELGGREARNWPFTAIRLKDGNTVVALTNGNKVVEFDPEGKIVWKVSNDDLPGKPIADACGCQRLPSGGTVIACYAANQGIKLFEVNREKQIVWKYDGPRRVHHFQILTTNGKPVEGTPLR